MRTLVIALFAMALALCNIETAFSASPKKPTYTINVRLDGQGKVTPKQAHVKQGKNKNIVIKPKKKYMIDALILNGEYKTNVPQKPGKPYILKLKKISQDISIYVSFDTKRNPPPTAEGLAVGSQISVVDPK